MDIMKPQLLQIGNICYRKNPVERMPYGGRDRGFDTDHQLCEEDVNDYANDYSNEYDGEESCVVGHSLEKGANGEFCLSFSIPSIFFKYIIGKKGETKKRIETETKTRITIPRQGEEGNIVIQGAERGGVLSAHSRVGVLTESARKHQPFTHFLSIPITSESIRSSFDDFKLDVLQSCLPEDGIDASIFQTPTKLHLTIGTLTLLDANEIQTAARLLSDSQPIIVDDVLRGERLELDVQGLEYMNDDPDAVDVLYAKIAPRDGASQMLQRLADRLVDVFTSARLMTREHDHVKLHVTVMNTLFRRDTGGITGGATAGGGGRGGDGAAGGFRRGAARESFRASQILKLYGEYTFGSIRVEAIHLSQRGYMGQDGYYAPAATVPLP